MWRVSALWAVASLALLAGLAGGAGAHPVAIPPPALGKAHDALQTAYAEEELALFTLSDFASTSGRAEAPGALKRSQAALGDASSALSNGGLPSSVSGDVADAQDDDIGALTAIATGKLGAARQKIATALEAKDGAMLRIEAQLMSGYPSIGEYLIPVKDAGPTSIVSWGGRLWFTGSNKGMLESLDPFAKGVRETQATGAAAPGFKVFKVPGHSRPQTLAEGPDGALWFTEYAANKIGRITTAGKITHLKLQYNNEGPDGIVALPNGSLAYVTYNDSSVGVITNGKISETEIQNGGRNPDSLAVGQIFVTEYTANKIGRVAVG